MKKKSDGARVYHKKERWGESLPFVGCFPISFTAMSYEAMLTKFITTLNITIMPNSVLYCMLTKFTTT